MSARTHETLVTDQFGPQAGAYVTSAVHASGPDLDQLAALVRGAGLAVLDLGCGGGHASYAVAGQVGRVVAYDLSADMLQAVAATAAARGHANIETRLGAAEALPFADASFDWVISRFSAHHWADLQAGLNQAARVLRPGGRVCFMDSAAPASRPCDSFVQAMEMLRDPSHVRNYSLLEWQAALVAAGLVPGAASLRKLRLDFPSWIARIRTPELHAQAILSLQQGCAAPVRAHFALEVDGSFLLDTLTILAEKP